MNIRTKSKNIHVKPNGETRFANELLITQVARGFKDEAKNYVQGKTERNKANILVMDDKQSWYGGWSMADRDYIKESHSAIFQYRKRWLKDNERYPWVHKRSRATGLSQHFRGRLGKSPETQANAMDIGKDYLAETDVVKYALTGRLDIDKRLPANKAKVIESAPYNLSKYHHLKEMNKKRFHVEFQQWHFGGGEQKRLPVYGAKVVLHMAESRRRTSVTSTYMPTANERFNNDPISERRAIDIAKKSIMHFEVTNKALDQKLKPVCDQYVFQRAEKHIEWSGRVQPYEQSKLFIYPYAGLYFMAYEVYLTSRDGLQTWRVFVDAEGGVVLGYPENLAHFAFYLKDSNSALALDIFDDTSSPDSFPDFSETHDDLSVTGNPCSHFMDIVIGKTNRKPNWDDNAKPAESGNTTTLLDKNLQFDANNIAIHARDVEEYFRQLQGGYSWQSDDCSGAQHDVCLRLHIDALEADDFVVHFNYGTKEIFFQLDSSQRGEGLKTEGGRRVYHPAWDPEVIYHEVIHALMWMRNSDPFKFNIPVTPFARSIIEGYAIYFSRACAASKLEKDSISPIWAKAAYRENEWGRRWSLFRPDQQAGQDFLSIPNCYPGIKENDQDELWGAYDVGMVWARALWDIRSLVGAEIGDRLVLEAYNYAKGWIHGFETVAEGLLDEPLKAQGIADNDAINSVFGARGIIADQGIQALLSHTINNHEYLFIGSDQGILMIENGVAKSIYNAHEGGVVDMVAKEDDLYIATETGVLSKDFTQNNAPWETKNKQWPVGQRPFSLMINDAESQLYMGGGNGIWQLSLDNNSGWKAFKPSDNCDSKDFLGYDMALDKNGSLCATSLKELRFFHQDRSSGGCWADSISIAEGSASMITCVVAHENTIYCGTDKAGISQIDEQGVKNIAPILEIQFSSILSLAVIDDFLYVGTNKGIWYADLDELGSSLSPWQQITKTAPCIVTAIVAFDDHIYAATVRQGLWFGKKSKDDSWARNTDDNIDKFAGVTIPILNADNTEATYPKSTSVVNIYPFDLESDEETLITNITIGASPSEVDMELWSLEANIELVQIIDSASADYELTVPEGYARFAVITRLRDGNNAEVSNITIRT